MASPEVLKRLEEIERDTTAPTHPDYTPWDAEIDWLLRLTRALLESQGELMERFRFASSFGTRYTHHGKQEACKTCQMIARAERVRRGEV